jgi:hypothetical protein
VLQHDLSNKHIVRVMKMAIERQNSAKKRQARDASRSTDNLAAKVQLRIEASASVVE